MRLGHARHQSGTSLVEALIGFLVLSVGLLASTRWQLQLRQAADLARQQSEAVRLAQQDMEQLRAYLGAGTPSGAAGLGFESIGGATLDLPVTGGSTTRFRLVRQLGQDPGAATGTAAGMKAVSVTVTWQDTRGQDHRLRLDSVISRQSPSLPLSLAQAPGVLDASPVRGRHLAIPAEAADLGDGRSAFKPLSGRDQVWVLDNRRGELLARCDGVAAGTTSRQLGPGDLGRCTASAGLLVSGRVRFAVTAPPALPVAASANDPPRPLDLRLVTSSAGHLEPASCLGEAVRQVDIGSPGEPRVISVPLAATPASEGLSQWTELGDRQWRYHCAVPPAPPVSSSTTGAARPHWSGQLQFDALGWTIGTAPGALRICRYSADTDGSGGIDQAAENPLNHTDVDRALVEQNFLVIDGRQDCPAPAADTGALGSRPWTDRNPATVPHQP